MSYDADLEHKFSLLTVDETRDSSRVDGHFTQDYEIVMIPSCALFLWLFDIIFLFHQGALTWLRHLKTLQS